VAAEYSNSGVPNDLLPIRQAQHLTCYACQNAKLILKRSKKGNNQKSPFVLTEKFLYSSKMFTLLKYDRLSKKIGGITVATLPAHRKPDRTEVTSPNLPITILYACTGDFFLKEKSALKETH